ncbi:high-affinity Fe2+/Pb2+ permease [Thioflavicoccus mobilis 8321]|uniref:High-affinity Fe2+/Pb2+ permease n=1 Tax=Thioflavicoccus mobilis 8321 TaxID=765912 RepID=L0GUK9_9GAMM|nr:FTR1 family protein [Thioflavicoccus mobilis]AGA89497.1 high-affinity Fe2+/Pb2+ permease [Thioflavicoccus mobilis 8321]
MKTRLLLIAFVLFCLPAAAFAAQGVTEYYEPVVAEIVARGDAAVETYDPSQGVITGNLFSRLYFDVFESTGMEFTLGLKDNAFMMQIESGFSLVISQSMRGEAKDVLERSWASLKKDLDDAVERYSSGEGTTFWGRVVQSFIILFREGIEAMLVVAALVAYLRRSGYPDKVKTIWQGVALALLASVGAAWLLNRVVGASGASQEAIEGVTMLIASAVLIYVSYWLTAKRDADRWQAFIKNEMDKAIGRGSLFALGFVAFLAVFREGAETILFYQALIGGSSGQLNAIWAGMAIAAAALAIVYLVVRIASIRLPIGTFFGGTAILLYLMAFVFTGQGLLELQVSGLVATTRLEGWPMISWLGIFPTRESIGAQTLVLAILPLGWLLMKLRRKRTGAPKAAPAAEGD